MSVHIEVTYDEVAIMQLQELLQQYATVFAEPTGLPSKRLHDHCIPLKDEHQMVKLRPYRYSAAQKDEIKKLVLEMASFSIIKDNTSPFASPVVLDRKSVV